MLHLRHGGEAFFVDHEVIAEMMNLVQGRVGLSVFAGKLGRAAVDEPSIREYHQLIHHVIYFQRFVKKPKRAKDRNTSSPPSVTTINSWRSSPQQEGRECSPNPSLWARGLRRSRGSAVCLGGVFPEKTGDRKDSLDQSDKTNYGSTYQVFFIVCIFRESFSAFF